MKAYFAPFSRLLVRFDHASLEKLHSYDGFPTQIVKYIIRITSRYENAPEYLPCRERYAFTHYHCQKERKQKKKDRGESKRKSEKKNPPLVFHRDGHFF
jgi:hypothetical protein